MTVNSEWFRFLVGSAIVATAITIAVQFFGIAQDESYPTQIAGWIIIWISIELYAKHFRKERPGDRRQVDEQDRQSKG